MTTAIYVRISRDTEQAGLGVARQRTDCEKLCRDHGWSPTLVYEDNDTSAYSGKRRPAYQRLLDDIKNGDIQRVVAWHPDRLHRSPRELEDFIDLIDAAACDVQTVTAGRYDLSTPTGRQTARIVGAVARGESEHKSERIRRKHLELAENGALSGGGTRPYGYQRVVGPDGRHMLVVDEAEAAVIVDMMRRYLAGESLISLCRDLNANAVPTAAGGTWRPGTLRGILTGAVISGQREHHGRIVARGPWPAIVTPEQTDNARAVAAFHAARGTRTRDTHVLTGLVTCGRCGAAMHAGAVVGRTPKLRCRRPPAGCGRTVIVRDELCAVVVETILSAFDAAAVPVGNQPTPAAARATTRLREAEAQLAELATAYADRVISLAQWKELRDKVERRVGDIREELGAAVTTDHALLPFRGKPGALRKAWPDLSIDQRRAVIAAVIEEITIGPAVVGRKAFDDGRIEIRWRA